MLTTLYCDASFRDGRGGGAAYIRSNKGVLRWADGFSCSTAQEAEAFAMLVSTQFAVRNWPETKTLLIVNDNKSCVEYLWSFADIKLKNPRVRKHLDDLLEYARKNKIKVRSKWVRSHQKDKSVQTWVNNHVDKIAKNHL
jgi:ribonuclease HI